MTPNRSLPLAVVVAALAPLPASAGLISTLDDIEFWVGSGGNRSALVVDWDNPSAVGDDDRPPIAWGYRWEAGTQVNGLEMFEAIAAADPRLRLDTEFFPDFGVSALFGIGYDRDGDGFFEADPDDSYRFLPFGDPSAETWSYFTAESSPFDGSSWDESTSGFEGRILTDGSWDGWRVNFDPFAAPTAPTAEGPRQPLAAEVPAAVPEPGTWLLLTVVSGGAAVVRRRRGRRAC